MSDEHKSEEGKGAKSVAGRPAWIAGAVLIAIGLVFIIRSVAGFTFDNWWALFILIPAGGSLWTAWTIFVRNGRRFNAASRGPLVGGLVLLYICILLLFDLDWGVMWPGFFIIIGVSLLLTAMGGTSIKPKE